jgi:hypothetical protein
LGWDSPVREIVHPKYMNLEEGLRHRARARHRLPNTRRIEREAGRVPKLKPGESRRFAIDVGLHTTTEAVRAVSDQIERIQIGRPTQIDRSPER